MVAAGTLQKTLLEGQPNLLIEKMEVQLAGRVDSEESICFVKNSMC